MTETPDPAERQEILTAAARMMGDAVPLEEPPATSQLPDAVSGSASGSPDLEDIAARRARYLASHDHRGAFACCTAHASADDVPALLAEVDRLRAAMAAQCNCAPGSPDCEGPQVDCPIHGAVHELHEARAENKRLREELNNARREERERCAAALKERADRAETYRTANSYRTAAAAIRALSDEDAPNADR